MRSETRTSLLFVAPAILATFITLPESTPAQYVPRLERGDPSIRLRNEIDGNSIRTSVFNFGLSGRTAVGMGVPYEWPRDTGRMYMALLGMFVGGAVTDATGNPLQIVDVPTFRTNPATGGTWNLEPVRGYGNQSFPGIARSNDPGRWPASWPDKLDDATDPGWQGKWNGLLGKDQFIDGVEMYYHASDDLYNRYEYYPDITDPSRRGLGIIVSQRVLEWNTPLLDSAVVFVTDIWNAGTKDIDTAATTLWIAGFLGGDGDAQDDLYGLGDGNVYLIDADGISANPAFAGARVGTVGIVLLETPEDKGLTNFRILPAGAINFNAVADSYFWTEMMTPGRIDDPLSSFGDTDAFASTGFFSLPAGTYRRLSYAVVFGSTNESRTRNIRYLKAFYSGGPSAAPFAATITSPTPGQVVSGTAEIRWDAHANDPSLLVDILLSTDNGNTWTLIAENEQNDGTYSFNTLLFPDAVLCRLRIVAYGTSGLGWASDAAPFTINNPGDDPPQVQLAAPLPSSSAASTLPVLWFAADPEGQPVGVVILLREPGSSSWIPATDTLPNTGSYSLDISSYPNGRNYALRLMASDGVMVGEDSVDGLAFQTPRYGLDDTAYVTRSAVGTGTIQPHFIDPAAANGHYYRATFHRLADMSTVYDVYDETASYSVLLGATEVRGDIEGPLFDGVRLLVRNDSLTWNAPGSGWSRPDIDPLSVRLFRYQFTVGQPIAADFEIRLGSDGSGTSQAYLNFPAKAVNFTVRNLTTGEDAPFAFIESDGTNGRFSGQQTAPYSSDVIVLLSRDSTGSFRGAWSVSLSTEAPGGNPLSGDVAAVRFFKPFQEGDIYRFQSLPGFVLGVPPERADIFTLEPNYPNPFNPKTTIRYTIAGTGGQGPGASDVRLSVYDVLGREVAVLVNERKDAGSYQVEFDASGLASGMYVYRMTAGGSVLARKMMLLK